ncbi:Zinc finger BED domain-containing protein 5 [Thelohanellus kitauei]|uniref:Zinc finger BED domain-containing protein 5 n=1 Tax=Thelohanellus kitauei TaxID=669202 RepID=A0A0C2N0P9_THEKT|nr:Zinc finger BED domain-containing protein 5 [Thelohanellus kitauei]
MNKDTNYFISKFVEGRKTMLDVCGPYNNNIDAVEESYLVELKIGRAMKPHTIAEDSLLPAVKDIVRAIIVEEFVNKLNCICVSNHAVHMRITGTSADIIDQIIYEMKSLNFQYLILSLMNPQTLHIAENF